MMNRFILFWLVGVSLSAASDFKVCVVNGSRDSLRVAAARVELLCFAASAQDPALIAQKDTGSDGCVSFRLTLADSASDCYFSSVYSGIRYYSDKLNFAQPPHLITLVIFDTTTDRTSLSIPMHHLIVEEAKDRLHLREMRVLQNGGKSTIVSKHNQPLLRIAMPVGFSDFSPLTRDFDLAIEGDSLAVRGVLPPGNRTLSFSYTTTVTRKEIPLSLHFPVPTRNLDLFIHSEHWSLTSSLQDLGDFSIRGKIYRRRHGEEFAAGQTLSVLFKKEGQSDEGFSPYLTMTLAFLLLTGGFLFSRVNNTAASSRLKRK
ncbi:MAG: hypothetical protein ONB12_08010 [candidate division KSB1 bacterium]|nr:hypothetical protein [candidate division KSB1 bacterium]